MQPQPVRAYREYVGSCSIARAVLSLLTAATPEFHNFAAASIAHKAALVVMTNGEDGRQVIEQLIAPESMDRLLH
jgi:hypothetical protein